MMGQPWQKRKKYSADEDIEEEEWRGAGYIDEPRKGPYLPGSVNGSRCDMAALAKKALMLVSEFGCPHVFLTLTCNPEWLEIKSQLISCQTAFDQPEVTVPVFKSRLNQFKTNILKGKYFQSDREAYMFHVIEYQYQGLPHAHMVFRLRSAPDIDAIDHDQLISFVDRNLLQKFIANCLVSKGMNIIT